MSQIAYVNGAYVGRQEGAVSIEDRGYQFADGIYEVIYIVDGKLIDEERHLARLERSLNELRIDKPMEFKPLSLVMRELIRRNYLREGFLYMQITRGVARRDHAFPAHATPVLTMTVNRSKIPSYDEIIKGVKVITVPDIRWKRRDIKSISLLPNCLCKQEAREAGAYEAWQVDEEGFVTEGTSSNAWIVTTDNELVTRKADYNILNGITRLAVLDAVADEGVRFVERPFTVEEAYAAKEAFVTSTISFVKPIHTIDDKTIGDGKIGAVSDLLLKDYFKHLNAGAA